MCEIYDNIYKNYCSHGNPVGYSMCPGCAVEKQEKKDINYIKYMQEKTKFFWQYYKDTFNYDPKDASDEPKLPDEFIPLKRSKSQEQLKKEYHKLARKIHPDKPGGDTSLFQRLQNIYERLLFKFSL